MNQGEYALSLFGNMTRGDNAVDYDTRISYLPSKDTHRVKHSKVFAPPFNNFYHLL